MSDQSHISIPKRLFTVSEAAYYLGHTIWGVRTLIWDGELPVVRKTPRGKQWITQEALDEFIQRHTHTEAPPARN